MLRQSAIYLVANLFSVAVGLVSVMVFTRLMTPAEYGIYVLGVSVAATINGALFTWLKMSVLRFQSEGEQRDLRRTALIGYLLTASTLPLAFLLLMAVTSIRPSSAAVIVAYVLTVSLFEIGQEMLRARLLAVRYAIGSIVRSFLFMALGVSAVATYGDGISLLTASVVAYLIAALLLGWTTWGGKSKPFEKNVLIEMAVFGAPLTLLGLSTALHLGLDRLILTYLYDTEVAGRFAAVNDFARQCIAIPCAGVFSAFLPLAVRGAANDSPEEVQRQLSRGAELVAAVVLPSAIGLALVSTHVSELVFGVQFRGAAIELLPILAFSWAAHLVWQQYVHVSFHLAKRPHLVIIHTALTLVLGAGLMLMIASAGGNRNAALAMVATEFTGLVLGFYLTRYGYPLPLPWKRLQRVALAGLAMGLITFTAGKLIPGTGLVELVVMVIAGGLSYAVAAIYFDVGDVQAKLRERKLAVRLPQWLVPPAPKKPN